jgi:hypothetical protein
MYQKSNKTWTLRKKEVKVTYHLLLQERGNIPVVIVVRLTPQTLLMMFILPQSLMWTVEKTTFKFLITALLATMIIN